MVPGKSAIAVLGAARSIGLFKMGFYRRDSAREGNGLVRVAEDPLPVLIYSPPIAAVSTSKVLSPYFFYCFLQSCKAFVSVCCVPS